MGCLFVCLFFGWELDPNLVTALTTTSSFGVKYQLSLHSQKLIFLTVESKNHFVGRWTWVVFLFRASEETDILAVLGASRIKYYRPLPEIINGTV